MMVVVIIVAVSKTFKRNGVKPKHNMYILVIVDRIIEKNIVNLLLLLLYLFI